MCYGDLRALEQEFGRDLLTSGYTKLPKVINIVKSFQDMQSFPFNFTFVIRMMLVTLQRKVVPPAWFTLATMDTKIQDGTKTAGWVAMTVTKGILVKHLFGLMHTMDTADSKKMHETLRDAFIDPAAFHARFPVLDSAAKEPHGAEGEVALGSESQVAYLCEGLSKAGHFVAELLFDLYTGDFDSDLKAITTDSHITTIFGAGADERLTALGPKLREFMRLASPATAFVGTTCGAPALGVRCLARISSDPGGVSPEEKKEQIMQERQQLWTKAQNQRTNFVAWPSGRTKRKVVSKPL